MGRDDRGFGQLRISERRRGAENQAMTWTLIRLELARSREFPQGSAAHAYLRH